MLGALTIAAAVQRWRENIFKAQEQRKPPVAPATAPAQAVKKAAAPPAKHNETQKTVDWIRKEESYEEEQEPISVSSRLIRLQNACSK
ncbi:unnamed protein product [Gongylonema pulchrum]|uniref:Secreted protein n=1 Tax=Gongylonema pulchrum TaxID=637853 RepID=A0A183D226_9BILA|nr:unnamed protein product [Gongylonema pulchrum]